MIIIGEKSTFQLFYTHIYSSVAGGHFFFCFFKIRFIRLYFFFYLITAFLVAMLHGLMESKCTLQNKLHNYTLNHTEHSFMHSGVPESHAFVEVQFFRSASQLF